MSELTPIKEGLWEASTLLKVALGFHLTARMTVIEAGPGELLLYSPVDLDDSLAAAIGELGEVRWIVAPNDYHHMFVGKALEHFPNAAAYGAPRALNKQDSVNWAGALADGISDLPESVVPFFIDGMTMVNETVFWLPERDALVSSDLVFNLRDYGPLPGRMMLKFFLDYHDRPSQGREYRWFFVRDEPAYRERMIDLLDRPFDTLVMAHGETVLTGGNDALREAVSWAL